MKRLLMIPALLLALTVLTACGAGTKVGQFIDAVTTPIANPVKPNNIYQVKLTFNLAVKGGNKWASYCWSKSYKDLMQDAVGKYVCENRRATRRMLSEAADDANEKINKAAKYIRDNPTFSPVSLIDDAWNAVTHYQDLVAPITP